MNTRTHLVVGSVVPCVNKYTGRVVGRTVTRVLGNAIDVVMPLTLTLGECFIVAVAAGKLEKTARFYASKDGTAYRNEYLGETVYIAHLAAYATKVRAAFEAACKVHV